MISVYILVLKNASFASIDDARTVFASVNDFLIRDGRKPLFEIQLAGRGEDVGTSNSLFSIRPEIDISAITNPQLIIIPKISGAMMSSIYLNKDYAHWIADQYKNGAEIASLCTGAFLLAFSGVLNGRQCTTHWAYANEFSYCYPAVNLVDEKMITDQQGLYSSGGSNAYWNLLLHLVEKYAGREMAIRAAKHFVVDLDKNMQSPFIIFHGQKDHEDKMVKDVQEYIERNYAEKLTVDQIADQFNLSRRTIERRFKKATRNSISEYIQRVKIEASKKQFEIGRKSITEVMFAVGYSDLQAYRDVFKRITGMTPVAYRNKYKN